LQVSDKEGWYIKDNNVYYIKNGTAVTGWQRLNKNGRNTNSKVSTKNRD